jgi:hypothetical protein
MIQNVCVYSIKVLPSGRSAKNIVIRKNREEIPTPNISKSLILFALT